MAVEELHETEVAEGQGYTERVPVSSRYPEILLVVGARARILACEDRRPAEVVQHVRRALGVPEVAPEGTCLLEKLAAPRGVGLGDGGAEIVQRLRANPLLLDLWKEPEPLRRDGVGVVEPALFERDPAQMAQRQREPFGISELPAQCDCCLEKLTRADIRARKEHQVPEGKKPASANLCRDGFLFRQPRLEPAPAVAGTARLPERPDRRAQAKRPGSLPPLEQRGQRAPDVRQLPVEAVQPLELPPTVDAPLGLLGQRDEEVRMASAEVGFGTAFVEALGGVLADGLEHRVADAVGGVVLAKEVLLDETGQRVEVGVADGLRRLQGAAAGEDREAGEQVAFLLG